jgi:outer membrane protein assembly factor BamD (BamD/ComL family)
MQKFMIVNILTCLLILSACSSQEKKWEKAKADNTISALSDFIKLYPESKHIEEATITIEKLNWDSAFNTKNDSLLKECINKYPKSQRIPEAKDLLSQIKFPMYDLKQADCLEINAKGMSLSIGKHFYGINNDGSLTYEPDQLPMKMVVIWRDIDSRFTDFFEKYPICTGVAYLYMGPGKFRYLKKVDLNKTDHELADEFGVKY